MATYQELQQQLGQLYQQAEEARLAEKSAVLEKIKGLIIEHQLILGDLGFTLTAKRNGSAGAPKFIDPVTGSTWSGRGRSPKWLEGKNKSKFAVS